MTTVQQRPAAETETGRACPYCRFPLKEGIAVCECASCHAVHHDDCWGDNGGCAIVGCDGGDGESATTVAPVAISPPPPRRPGPIAISPDPEPSETHPLPKVGSAQRVAVAAPPAGARKRPWLIAAVFMLALAVAGAGAAYYFTTKKSSSTHPRPVAQPRSSGPVAGTANPAPTPSIPPPANPPTPVVSDRTRIERLLKRYYGDVQNGNYDAAWALLSPSYKQWKSSNGGRSGWMTQEQQNERSLDPSGLSVSITGRNRASGVATIYVSGMHFGPNQCDYVGYTWARKVSGTWYYDEGYVQDPARAAKWRPQQRKTLGVACEPPNNPY